MTNDLSASGGALNDEQLREQRLAELLARLADEARSGKSVDLDRTCREHPDLAGELRPLWGAVLVADAAGSHEELPEDEPPATVPLELPRRIGDYDLLEELGRGGMGVVFRARQVSLDRQVAIKMILRGEFASPLELERFRREAEAAARLTHPGIVPVYEVGEQQGRPYFCMKHIVGQTLAQRLAAGPMASREAARILAAVARAIQYAHQEGVLHRDLKPSNILIDEEGQPHVTDFGLAKQMKDVTSLTKSGSALGTPAYMAPEQAAGDRGNVGPASDVYSLGTILYQMLTGRPPFQAASPVDTVLMVLDQDPLPPRMLNPKVDRDLELITVRCLQKPPQLRYASALALAQDLEAYLNDEPISARIGRLAQVASWFRETHHATVLEHWGLLWMWHSLVLLIVCALTNGLHLAGFDARWYYIALWTVAIWAWAGVFWSLRRRIGPVTFVERQIAHVWAGAMFANACLFFVEARLGLPVLSLSPVLGLTSGMVFMVKAGILSGSFYLQAIALFGTALVMTMVPRYAHLLFGLVAAACFFFPGLKYYRQRLETDRSTNELRRAWELERGHSRR